MALQYHGQNTFAAGELSPSLHARTDLAKYQNGLKKARNVNIMPQGGVRNRPGTYHVAAAGDSTHKVRIIPFVYSDGQAYVLEFGENYIRFYTNDAPVVASSTVSAWVTGTVYIVGNMVSNSAVNYYCITAHTASAAFSTDAAKWRAQTAYEIPSTYLSAELFDLKVTQSADYLYIFHPLHAPQQLVRLANDSWQITPFNFKNGPFMLSNTSSGKTLSSSSTTFDYRVSNNSAQVIATGFYHIPSTTDKRVTITPSADTGAVTGDIVKLTSFDGALAATLNGNLFSVIVNPSDPFHMLLLCYLGTSTPITVANFTSYNTAVGKIFTKGPVTITANFPLFQSTHVGALFQMTETIPAQTVSATLTTTVASSSIKCGHTWRLITTGAWTGFVSVYMSTDGGTTWNALRSLQSAGSDNFDTSGDTSADQCLIYAKGTFTGACTINLSSDTFDWHGTIQIVTVASSTSATANILSEQGVGLGLASTNSTWQWAEGSWSNYRGWPTCGTFYQDRLCIASTVREPQTVWMSQTEDYTNFGISYPMVDSDAISALLPSRTVNIVRNMAVLGALVVLTSDSDFSIEPGSGGNLSPTSILITCHGHRGTSAVDPAIVGNELILMQQMGSVVRNLIYQFSVSGYMGDDIIVMAKHLLTGHTIIEMAYQQEPDSILWMVRDDGVLLSLTYMREQEVLAWSWHDTNNGTDLFESVAVIPNSTLGINEVWFVVNRGGTRYIERLAKRDMGSDPADYMMSDCAVTQDNGSSPSASVTGLAHLNGKTVIALVDGSVVTGLTVAAGATTLPVSASIVHIGLPYVSDIETLRIDTPNAKGTAQGRRIVIPEVTVRFLDSRGGYIKAMSQDIADPATTGIVGFDEILQHDAAQVMSAATPLKTLDYKLSLNGGYDMGSALWIRQTDPLPLTLIALFPKMEVSDN